MKNSLKHLAIIMDGNRRWAKIRGLPTLYGHKKGYELLAKLGDWCIEEKIPTVTVWAFSTENWKRSQQEVGFLFDLFRRALTTDLDKLHAKKVRLKVLGRLTDLPEDIQKMISIAEAKTKNNKATTLNIAINYGGRPEIVDMVKKAIKQGLKAEDITIENLQKQAYDPNLPAVDLMIRTSGEIRTSGFLLWHSDYAELYFTEKNWPEFTKADFQKAIKSYYGRQRRFGGN